MKDEDFGDFEISDDLKDDPEEGVTAGDFPSSFFQMFLFVAMNYFFSFVYFTDFNSLEGRGPGGKIIQCVHSVAVRFRGFSPFLTSLSFAWLVLAFPLVLMALFFEIFFFRKTEKEDDIIFGL